MQQLKSHGQIKTTQVNKNIKISNSFEKYIHCLHGLHNIIFLCLVEVTISAINNTKIFKISTDVKFKTTKM